MIATPERRGRTVAIVTVVALVGLLLAWAVDDTDANRNESSTELDTQEAELAAEAWTLAPYSGVGAWVDVYDWTEEFTEGAPPVGLDEIDRMAEVGIETLYLQTAHSRSAATGVIERDQVESLIERAHERGLRVVAWYLPPLVDVEADLRRLVASADLPVDGLGVDIEATEVTDVAERNRRLLELTERLRAEVGPDKAVAAITPSAVHLQVVNPAFWPTFPWEEVAAAYQVILPMAYWSIRDADRRDGEQYVGENIDHIRSLTGDPNVPIHVAGGIADDIAVDQVDGMVRAIQAREALGGSLYDWVTSNDEQWAAMAPLRTP